MGSRNESSTSLTLLNRLRQPASDVESWRELVLRYGPKIFEWCRHHRLQEADAEDVTQAVLIKLVEQLRTFDYDPVKGSFRAWLQTLTHHAWYDAVARRRKVTGSGDTAVQEKLESIPARDDLILRLAEEFDHELLDEAAARVRLRVAPHNWEAFRLLTQEGHSPAEVANQTNLPLSMVHVAKYKVQRALRNELRKLEGADA
jgi:RNA polymerase sigma factor (sigma-70 family)